MYHIIIIKFIGAKHVQVSPPSFLENRAKGSHVKKECSENPCPI
jgi:hypothetical protein